MQLVCVQGLGFVGSAMAAAVARVTMASGEPAFQVVGVDLPTEEGKARVASIAAGDFPFATSDQDLVAAVRQAHEAGNLTATTDQAIYEKADIVLVDVHLDVDTANAKTDFSSFRHAIKELGTRLPPGALVLVETTVPPGTCAKIVAPELSEALRQRGLPEGAILLAHSYERVMPGPDYLDSIVNYWRVYSGHTPEAAEVCRAFLTQVVDIERFPLTELASTTASETAKVMENTYRAVTISLMQEWGTFAERIGVDMFEVIGAARKRPTHSNMRQPGFGVGGYCLTKDPLFGLVSARQLFELPEIDFPVSRLAVQVNQSMPLHALEMLEQAFDGNLEGRSILLMGVAYRSEVDDTRYSPSETFLHAALKRGTNVACHDPYVVSWPETGYAVRSELPSAEGFDAVVLAVDHAFYRDMDILSWLGSARPIVLDANNVLTQDRRLALASGGHRLLGVGRGTV